MIYPLLMLLSVRFLLDPTPTSRPVIETIVVDASGGGDVRTIADALQSLADTSSTWRLIVIRPGDYREQVTITASRVALVGDRRDSTFIRFPVLRSAWVSQHGDDRGSGVINIADGVEDVILANLTIENTYGDSTGNHDHQFTIRGFDATKISLLYCTIRSAGGDAVSLWNRESGMYYHAYCSFEGWVDYVCPRGWCFITNSEFFGHNLSASIWHDGSAQREQKFVIRQSRFDGVPGFPLGRHHRDAQFFLLDCSFSEAMADTPIYSPRSPNTVPWVWGPRHYFWNCSRDGGDYPWFSDNLSDAEGSPDQTDVTAAWTFRGTWDPERTLPAVLPFPALPFPSDGATDIPAGDLTLRWLPARSSTQESVLFGTNPGLLADLHSSSDTIHVRPSTRYFWRVRSVVRPDTSDGPMWSFTTAP